MSNKSILIIGASGLVGSNILEFYKGIGKEAIGTYFSNEQAGLEKLDCANTSAIEKIISNYQPGVIIAPFALANVDLCETDRKLCWQQNITNMRNVADAARISGAKFVFFSTDYVFDGKNGPYTEGDPTCPINYYGLSKEIMEKYIAQVDPSALIARITVVYGREFAEKNFILRLLSNLKANRLTKVPIDQIGSPTYAADIGPAINDLLAKDASGIIHLSGDEQISRYEFARLAAEIFGFRSDQIAPVKTSELNQVAKRPLVAGLKTDLFKKITGRKFRGPREGLIDLKKQLER